MTIEDLKTKTLAQVSNLLGQGLITAELAQEYVDLWNKGPHFTKASLSLDKRHIYNFEDKD